MPIFRSKYPDIVIPNITIPQLIFGGMHLSTIDEYLFFTDVKEEDLDKIQYVDAFTEKTLNFREFQDLSFRVYI